MIKVAFTAHCKNNQFNLPTPDEYPETKAHQAIGAFFCAFSELQQELGEAIKVLFRLQDHPASEVDPMRETTRTGLLIGFLAAPFSCMIKPQFAGAVVATVGMWATPFACPPIAQSARSTVLTIGRIAVSIFWGFGTILLHQPHQGLDITALPTPELICMSICRV
jgi:hypothetical protein